MTTRSYLSDDHNDITSELRKLIENYDEKKREGPFVISHGHYYIAYRCSNRKRDKVSKIKVAKRSENDELYECTVAAEIRVDELKDKDITVLRRAEKQTTLSKTVLERLRRTGVIGYLHEYDNPQSRDIYWERM